MEYKTFKEIIVKNFPNARQFQVTQKASSILYKMTSCHIGGDSNLFIISHEDEVIRMQMGKYIKSIYSDTKEEDIVRMIKEMIVLCTLN